MGCIYEPYTCSITNYCHWEKLHEFEFSRGRKKYGNHTTELDNGELKKSKKIYPMNSLSKPRRAISGINHQSDMRIQFGAGIDPSCQSITVETFSNVLCMLIMVGQKSTSVGANIV